jgi:hypothetical protein
MIPRLHPEAAEEWTDAALRYDRKQPGLGDDFTTAVLDAFETIEEQPDRWPLVERGDGARRYVMQRFPFLIVYFEGEPGEPFHVVAIAQGNREPGYWRGR